jgi:hypothetical protein
MAIDLNLILFSPVELRKIVVDHARMVVSKEELASQAVFERVSGENVSDWDYQIAFSVLKEREPKIVRDSILGFARKYNFMQKELLKNNKLFSQMAWDAYKKIGVSFRSPAFNSMFRTESDLNFARFYIRCQLDGFARRGGNIIFNDWDKVEMVKYDSDFLFGVGQYKFRDINGNELESIWDFRQEKLPNFVYAKEL